MAQNKHSCRKSCTGLGTICGQWRAGAYVLADVMSHIFDPALGVVGQESSQRGNDSGPLKRLPKASHGEVPPVIDRIGQSVDGHFRN